MRENINLESFYLMNLSKATVRMGIGTLVGLGIGSFFGYVAIIPERSDNSKVAGVQVLDLELLKLNRDNLNGKNIRIRGRVYTDAGGYFWLIHSIGDEPYKTYALQLTAWPFASDPQVGQWSRVLQLKGIFSQKEQGSLYDHLIGPSQIILGENH